MLGDDAIADGALAVEGLTFAVATTIDATITLAETWVGQVLPRALMSEGVGMSEAFALSLHAGYQMNERVALRETARWALAVQIAETFDLDAAFVPALGAILAEAFGAHEAIASSFTFNLTVTQRVTLLDALLNFAAAAVSESLTLTDQTAHAYLATTSIAEFMALVGTFDRIAVLSLSIKDGFDLDEATLLGMIYQGAIVETISADVLYASPDGSVTTWAINTRTNAVTQYENFVFNSFAAMGRKYLAADQNGLYELNGAQDLTEPVVASMGGGLFQPNGAKLAGLKGVYLGLGGQGVGGGQGTWLLKLVMGDGREYVYQRLSNPNLMTTKFDIGKGLRSRYMSWELTNQDGQDFDFDNIEFVPMMSGRRI